MTDQQFDQIFRSYYQELYRQAYSMIRDAEESRDIVSQAFADLYDNPPSYGNDQQLRSYLRQRIRNRCLDYVDHLTVEEKVHRLYPIEHRLQTETDIAHEARLQQVRQCVEQNLTPQSRRIIELRYDEGLTYQQVADRLQISVAAVNKHVTQAFEKIRQLIH